MTRVIVALDVASFDDARALVLRIGGAADFYKIGLELYAADGPRAVQWLRAQGKDVFVDLKAHDIPNTVAGVARTVASLGARLFTVHAAGGEAMVRAAVDAAGAQDGTGCGVLAVTVLTSFDAAGYGRAVGRSDVDVSAEVLRLADTAAAADAHGVVCSGLEAPAVRERLPRLRTLVPGVRLAGGATHDQARVVSPAEAAGAGAAYIVVGRAVTKADDPAAVLSRIVAEVSERTLPQVP